MKMNDVCLWLQDKLKEKPRQAVELIAEGLIDGIAFSSLYRAFHKIHVTTIRTSFGKNKKVYWSLKGDGDLRMVCCEMLPLDEVHHEWAMELLNKFDYAEITEGSKEIPEQGEWFLRKGKYYWCEELEGDIEEESAGDNEQDGGMVL